jgi:hypothetical protein
VGRGPLRQFFAISLNISRYFLWRSTETQS